MSDFIRQCSKCGAKYEIFRHKLMMRDKDSLECDVCGTELMHWNGAEMFSAKLIHPELDKV